MNLDVFELAKRSNCEHIDVATNGNARYVGDCCVRHWQGRTWAELVLIMGHQTDEFIIQGGIGTLILRQKGNELHKAVVTSTTTPKRVTEEESTIRENTCLLCPEYRPLSDKCNLCGCGFIIKERTKSVVGRCPQGKW